MKTEEQRVKWNAYQRERAKKQRENLKKEVLPLPITTKELINTHPVDQKTTDLLSIQQRIVSDKLQSITKLLVNLEAIETVLLKKYSSELDKHILDNFDFKSQLDSTKSQLDSTKAELDSTKSQLDSTKSQLDSTKAELDSTKAELDSTKSQLDSTKAELDSTKIKLQESENKVKLLTFDLEGANEDIDELNETIKQLNSTIKKQNK
jgi:chromosome segregation ATPase